MIWNKLFGDRNVTKASVETPVGMVKTEFADAIYVNADEEPQQAFVYIPPDEEVKSEYSYIFELKRALRSRLSKTMFDKVFSILILIGSFPVFVILYLFNLIEGLLIPENRGPLIFYYNAISRGKVFRKYKIRLIKQKYIDKELQAKGDWHAFQNEWMPEARTYLGRFVKKFYLDELPQFFCVLKGDMSIIGPRPLAVHHYERDLEQGNVTRALIKGGLLGMGHINKGTPEMGKPVYEYKYIDNYIFSSPVKLLFIDISIILKGIKVMLKAKGL
ncbi:sugar transferase [Saccharicrinis sp. FJH54]|uniref:sugar transferase n=1 Tax=Saccharicrinis sp. FJH54 TaxID=3344665 RepID=UPI0035D4AF67